MRDIANIVKIFKKKMIGPLLLIFQIVITFTVIVNATHIISNKTQLLNTPTGADQKNTFYISFYSTDKDLLNENQVKLDMQKITSLNTVLSAAPINAIPMIGNGTFDSLYTDVDKTLGDSGAIYYTNNAAVKTLDMEILAGENFSEQDVLYVKPNSEQWPDSIIITKAFAEFLYPDDWRQVVSKLLYTNVGTIRVKGVVDKMQAPWYYWRNVEFGIFEPRVALSEEMKYVVRAEKIK